MRAIVGVSVLVTALSAFARLVPNSAGLGYLDSLIMYEQIYNDKVENTQAFTPIREFELPGKYRAENRAVFPLWSVLVPFEEVEVINTSGRPIDHRLIVNIDGKTHVRFFVHPHSKNFFEKRLDPAKYTWSEEYTATPTASYRSLIIWRENEPPMGVKVSLDAVIGESRRLVTRSQIERAAVASQIINGLDRTHYANRGMHFIDEPVSVYLKDFEYGYSTRELPHLPEGVELVPMFSLYAKKRGTSLLAKLIRKSGMPPRTFIVERIIKPMVQHAAALAFNEGLIMEPHQQNVLVALKNGEWTGEFYYRDLGGFHLSPFLRLASGKDTKVVPPGFNLESLKHRRASFQSNMIGPDSYLVGDNLYALRKCLEDEFTSIRKDWIEEQVIKIFSDEVFKYTGIRANTERSVKAAITHYMLEQSCKKLVLQ